MKDSELTKLAIANVSPFDPRAKGCTLPTGFCPNSFKSSGVIRTSGVLNSNGDGIINVNPSPYSDATCLWISGQGFNSIPPPGGGVGPDLVISNYQSRASRGVFYDLNPFVNEVNLKDAGLIRIAASNLPFSAEEAFIDRSSPSFTTTGDNSISKVRSRVISAGVKVTFSGTTLQDGGEAYALVEPNHENLVGYAVSNLLSKYTSSKYQRLNLRQDIELNMFPVTDAQRDYSAGLEACQTGYGNGLVARDGYLSAVNCGTTDSADLTNGEQPVALPIDTMNSGRSASCVVYPLSRKNQNCYKANAGTGAITIAGVTGQVTFDSGYIPTIEQNGINWSSNQHDYQGHLTYNSIDTRWYFTYSGGCPYHFGNTSQSITGFYSFLSVEPSVIGSIVINAGPAMAGQTFHVEYIVHCEYTGVGVQGRTEHNVPDIHGTNMVHAIVQHARETSGQNERATILSSVGKAALDIAGKEAPHIVDTIVMSLAPELAPMINPLLNKGIHAATGYLTRSLKRGRF